ncbi:hypothetical protein [Spongiactinospora sp. TRM90649]|uniref:hypothetical protein n=1 Tax=Spongiactinospora sp. TRM90649 TaxID=3031114 RepID=UPI0023F88995|nr:hypothetical protein [Spongiactinospora sp. TRM90649]MDF5756633.1 hypothetical protein [Spongiactinospora sp. TRM90649]
MIQGNMGYLYPLFSIAESLVDDEDQEHLGFGLGEIDEYSQLDVDDQGMNGMKVSTVVIHAIGAAVDHVLALSLLVKRAGMITNAGPWTLLRGAMEPAALAVWVLNGASRDVRRERALRVWRQDMEDRGKWEDDISFVVTPPAKRGATRAGEIVSHATSMKLRANQVATRLNYSDLVVHAAEIIGLNKNVIRAHWRASSGFAHGRSWTSIRLSSADSARRTRDGVEFSMSLAEAEHRKLAEATTAFLARALDDYAAAAHGPGAAPTP